MCIYDTCTWWKKFLLRWKKLNLDSSVQKASLCSLNILQVWSSPRARRGQWDIFGQRMQSLRSGWGSRGNSLQIPSAGMSFCLVWGSQVLCEFVSSYWNTQTSTMRAQIPHAVRKSRALSFVWFPVFFPFTFPGCGFTSISVLGFSFMFYACFPLCQVTYNSSVFLCYCCL